MKISLLTTFALAGVSLAAPAPRTKSLVKRSFKAPSPGRTVNNPLDDINRAHRKWGWSIIVANENQASNVESSSAASPVIIYSTVATVTAPQSTAPLSTGSGSPPYGNGTGTPTVDNVASTNPTYAPSSTAGNEDGEAETTPEENEAEYLTPVNVGGQLLNLNFDTGSADLWVFSTKLSQQEIQGQTAFNSAKSESWEPYQGATWNITYGDGSGAGGVVGFDTVDVGGSTVKKQCVELAEYVSQQMVQDPNSDGLLGLAFSNINTVEPESQKTFFENVMDDLTEPLFTADLEESNGKGTYEFGKIDTSKYSGEIHYTPVDNSDGFWAIDVPSYKFGSDDAVHKCVECDMVIADTGTSLLYVEQAIVDKYYGQLEGVDTEDGVYAAPCDTVMPDFSINIGGWFATLKGKDMFYTRSQYPGRENMCWGGLQPSQSSMSILGDVFLKQFFAVFDGGNMRFGVAEKN